MDDMLIDCLRDIEISRYIDSTMTRNEVERVDTHLNQCLYCLKIVANSIISLKSDIENMVFELDSQRILPKIKQKLREITVFHIEDDINFILSLSTEDRQILSSNSIHSISNLIKEAFSYPCPRFDPVFGDAQSRMLSPYGKVKFPVRFEWTRHEQADKYILSLSSNFGYFATTSTSIELDQETLQDNQEYMWTLSCVRGEAIIDEVSGFFSLVSEEEQQEITHIENVFSVLDSDLEKHLLLGAFFEAREIYIEGIRNYKKSYDMKPSPAIAYRIASCYHLLELEELRNEWNKIIVQWEGSL